MEPTVGDHGSGRANMSHEQLPSRNPSSALSRAHLHWEGLLTPESKLSRDRVVGMFLALAVGDALGLPVEVLSPEEIHSRFGRIENFITNPTHKWYHGSPAGTWSDDTQLSLAVAVALSTAGGFDPVAMMEVHAREAATSTVGWGRTTRAAVERFQAEREGREGPELGPGTGNGVAMKLAPFAAWIRTYCDSADTDQLLVRLNDLTHPSPLSRSATRALGSAFLYVFSKTPETFNAVECAECSIRGAALDVSDDPSRLLLSRLESLPLFLSREAQEGVTTLGGGGCYVADSLPAALFLFLRNPHSWECVVDAVNAGGDTDSNASIVGALFGALHGSQRVPEPLVAGLQQRERVRAEAGRFSEFLRVG